MFFFLSDAPVCASSVVVLVGASLEESVSVPCRVNADPPDVDFEWTFSSSGERFEVPHGHYTTLQDHSGNNNSRNNHGDGARSTFVQPNESHSESDGKIFAFDNDDNMTTIHNQSYTLIFNHTGKHTIQTVSELIYTPKNEREYGTLACWGKNSIGKQTEPCLFQVVPAGNCHFGLHSFK